MQVGIVIGKCYSSLTNQLTLKGLRYVVDGMAPATFHEGFGVRCIGHAHKEFLEGLMVFSSFLFCFCF